VVHKTIDYPGVPVDHGTIEEKWGVLKNVRVPIRPHFGTPGLAPKVVDGNWGIHAIVKKSAVRRRRDVADLSSSFPRSPSFSAPPSKKGAGGYAFKPSGLPPAFAYAR
jgi:hypothetical protein